MKILNKDNYFITSLIFIFLLFSIRQSFYLLQIDLVQFHSTSYSYLIHMLIVLLLIPTALFTLYYLPSIFALDIAYKIDLRLEIILPEYLPVLLSLKEKLIIQKNRYKLIQVFRF